MTSINFRGDYQSFNKINLKLDKKLEEERLLQSKLQNLIKTKDKLIRNINLGKECHFEDGLVLKRTYKLEQTIIPDKDIEDAIKTFQYNIDSFDCKLNLFESSKCKLRFNNAEIIIQNAITINQLINTRSLKKDKGLYGDLRQSLNKQEIYINDISSVHASYISISDLTYSSLESYSKEKIIGVISYLHSNELGLYKRTPQKIKKFYKMLNEIYESENMSTMSFTQHEWNTALRDIYTVIDITYDEINHKYKDDFLYVEEIIPNTTISCREMSKSVQLFYLIKTAILTSKDQESINKYSDLLGDNMLNESDDVVNEKIDLIKKRSKRMYSRAGRRFRKLFSKSNFDDKIYFQIKNSEITESKPRFNNIHFFKHKDEQLELKSGSRDSLSKKDKFRSSP